MKIFNLLTALAILALCSFSTFATPVYLIAPGGDMFFYKHAGFDNGSSNWPIQAKKIGVGWNFKQVFAGDNGAIYAITQTGDMFFYKHAGYNDGSTTWPITQRQIGNGWNFKHVFAGDNGAVYGITESGDMFFYKHAGISDGSANWPIQGRQIGNGWHFKHVFAGDNGAVYAITESGDMFFYKHAGINDGSANWPIQGRRIGPGWNFKQVFAGGEGAVYAIAENGDMFFYKHAGFDDGSNNWPIQGRKIGNSWIPGHVFAGRDTTDIPVTMQELQIRRFTTSVLSNADADGILREATNVLQTKDGSGDVDCNVAFSRRGNVGVFTTGDGSIDSEAEFDDVIDLAGYVKVVNAINWCTVFNPNIVGCAPRPGDSFTVVRLISLEGIQWAHEYGHTKGLRHRADVNAVMNDSLFATCRRITAAECLAFRR